MTISQEYLETLNEIRRYAQVNILFFEGGGLKTANENKKLDQLIKQ